MTGNDQSSTGSEISTTESEDNIRRTNKQEINNKYIVLVSLLILSGLAWFFWDDITDFLSPKPDLGGGNEKTNISPIDYRDEYNLYFKEVELNQELYDLEVIKTQSKGKDIDYSDVENIKWKDSPTTPKASSSKLPANPVLMIPISKEE